MKSPLQSAPESTPGSRGPAAQRAGAATAPAGFDASPRQAAQRRALDAAFGPPLQRAASPEEELPAQGKADPLQRAAELDDEMPAQGKADPVQRAADLDEELPS